MDCELLLDMKNKIWKRNRTLERNLEIKLPTAKRLKAKQSEENAEQQIWMTTLNQNVIFKEPVWLWCFLRKSNVFYWVLLTWEVEENKLKEFKLFYLKKLDSILCV